MRNLLDFLKKYNYWFVFALCEAASIVLLFRFNNYQGSVWFTTANEVVGKVYGWEADVLSYLHLRDVNRQLTNKNVVLEQRVNILSEKLEKMEHKETYGELRQDELLQNFKKIDAQVIDNSINKTDNYITINKGSLDGVKPEMGVVSGTSVVGIVYLTSAHYALVIPMLNRKSNISCSIRGGSYFGNLSWDGRNPLYVTLNDIPRHAHVMENNVIETSGHSDVFPRGLFVGKVKEVSNSRDGLFFQLKIHLGIDYAQLREVCVVYNENQSEIRTLQDQGQGSAPR